MADDPQGKEEKIQASLAKARARVKTAPPATAAAPIATKPAGQYIVPQHELWPEVARALPNEIVRSALFNAKNKKSKREHLKNAEIAVIGTGKMTYSGEELRQDDQTLWLQLIHLARSQPLGQVITFTPNSFCLAVGWNVSGKSYECHGLPYCDSFYRRSVGWPTQRAAGKVFGQPTPCTHHVGNALQLRVFPSAQGARAPPFASTWVPHGSTFPHRHQRRTRHCPAPRLQL